jgi:hypothetical protein
MTRCARNGGCHWLKRGSPEELRQVRLKENDHAVALRERPQPAILAGYLLHYTQWDGLTTMQRESRYAGMTTNERLFEAGLLSA